MVRWEGDASWTHKIYKSSPPCQYGRLSWVPNTLTIFLMLLLYNVGDELGLPGGNIYLSYECCVLAWNYHCHYGRRVGSAQQQIGDSILNTCRLVSAACINGQTATEVSYVLLAVSKPHYAVTSRHCYHVLFPDLYVSHFIFCHLDCYKDICF